VKLPAYQKYKPSGVEWVGDVPEHWDTTRFRFLVRSSNAGEVIDRSYWHSGDELLFSCQRESMASDFPDFPLRKRTTENDLLVTRNGTPYVHVPPANAIYSNVVQRCILKHDLLRSFIALALETACERLRGEGYGVSIPSFSYEKWCDLPLPLPTPAEQRAIAAFLDRETGRMDRLVAKKRELIERLQEKRTALIACTVSRGLNPNAKLKPSGIEWLGDIPEHWEVKPLKWHSHCQSGDGISYEDVVPSQTSENRIPVIGGNGLMGFCEAANTHEPVIVIGRVGALCGNVHKIDPPAWITDNALVLRADARVFDRDYLAAVLKHRNLNELADKTAQPLITGTLVGDERVPRPPLPEQRAIADHLDRETAKIDRLVAKVEEAVERLQEYRTALITAAVTGKIDVRKEAA
jgi:type I restriction enzyme S subunit